MQKILVFASVCISLAYTCTTVNGVSGACNMHLNDLVFTGAHNAGAGAFGVLWHWSGVVAGSCFYRNQDKSITQQLNLGIRYFDFDTAYISASQASGWWEEGIIIVHNNAYSRSLKRALKEIDNFLGNNPNEVVVIRLKDNAEWARSMIKANLDREFAVFQKTRLNGDRNPLLRDAIDQNKRVVVFLNGDFGYHSGMNGLAQIESFIGNGATSQCYSVDDVYSKLMSDSRIANTYYQVQVDWFQSYGLCNWDLAGLCDGNELYKIEKIDKKLREATGRGINLVMIDFVGSGHVRLADVVKRINRNRIA